MSDSQLPEAMIKRYIERRQTDLAALEKAFAQKEWETFCRVGHQLKGNAATFEFFDLETLGIELEKAGETKNEKEAERLLSAFGKWISARS